MNEKSQKFIAVLAFAIVTVGALLFVAAVQLPVHYFSTASYPVYITDAPDVTLQAIYQGDEVNRIWVKDFEPVPHNLPPWEKDQFPGYAYSVSIWMRVSDDECTNISVFLDQFGIEYWIPHCD